MFKNHLVDSYASSGV